MDEFFAFHVDYHIDELREILKILKAIDKYPLDIVDSARAGEAVRRLGWELEAFARHVEAARMTGVPA